MNIGIIFAGGSGQRMGVVNTPKQFLEVDSKPIIIYTLEIFQKSIYIDSIIISCISTGIDYLKELIAKFGITKVKAIVPGGKTGQESIYNALKKAHEMFDEKDYVYIHDGVRPLINVDTIKACHDCLEENRTAITVSPAIETIVLDNNNEITDIIDRSVCQYAKAPQCFVLGDIYKAHLEAIKENKCNFIDSACLMSNYGYKLFTITGPSENIKITTPIDYYTFEAIIHKRKEQES